MVRRRNVRKPPTESVRVTRGGNTPQTVITPEEGPVHQEGFVYYSLFPRWIPWLVALVTFAARTHYVCEKKNWWILHPDEVYQGIEVAHSEVYGYGLRMYEYLPPPVSGTRTPTEEQESALGFYGLRSFIYPHIYSLVFSLLDTWDSNLNLFLIGRLFHVAVSSSLPLAVYRLTTRLYGNHDISCLAAILVSTSLHLTIFGTHPLVNSFLSPCFVYILSMVFSANHGTSSVSENGIVADDAKSQTPVVLRQSRKEGSSETRAEPLTVQDAQHSNSTNRNVRTSQTSASFEAPNGSQYGTTTDTDNSPTMPYNEKEQPDDHRWFWTYFKIIKPIVSGFILGITCYIRVDLLLLLALLLVGWYVLYVRGREFERRVLKYLSQFLFGMFLAALYGGLVDYCYYGLFFLSPCQWINFNVVNGMSGKIFGKSHFMDYLWNISAVPSAVFLNLCSVCALLYICWTKNRKSVLMRTPLVFLTATLIVLVTVYSLQSHKETRILHNVFVLQCMIWAGSVKTCLVALSSFRTLPMKRVSYVLISCVLLLQGRDLYGNFPSSADKSNSQWAFNGHWDSGEVNVCLDYIRRQNDVTGVVLDYTIYGIGGFALIRNDVPLITRIHHEYHVFDSRDLPLYRKNINSRLRLANRLSDIIQLRHTRYLLGKIFNNTQYNYIVTKNLKRFRPLGFTSVHNFSQFHVLKLMDSYQMKNSSIISRMRLRQTLQQSKFDKDAAILEFEGSWLFSVGMYRNSVERLRAAIAVNSSRVRPFQLMSLGYSSLEMPTEAADIERQCFELHTFAKCMEPQSRLILNEDYNIDL